MRARHSATWLLLGAVMLFPAACQDFQPSKQSSFKGKYMLARGALEDGAYNRAIRNYQALLKQSGPLEPRVRLEYAHALLRDDQFEAAAQEARLIARTQSGDARKAALVVQGTADHEAARAARAQGDRSGAVKTRLQAARDALDEVLKDGDAFDPLGAMAARRKLIDAELAAF